MFINIVNTNKLCTFYTMLHNFKIPATLNIQCLKKYSMFAFLFPIIIICLYWLSTANSYSKLPRKSIGMLCTCPNNPCLSQSNHTRNAHWVSRLLSSKRDGRLGSHVMSNYNMVNNRLSTRTRRKIFISKNEALWFFPQGIQDFFTMCCVKTKHFFFFLQILDKDIWNWFRIEILCPISNFNYMKNLVC